MISPVRRTSASSVTGTRAFSTGHTIPDTGRTSSGRTLIRTGHVGAVIFLPVQPSVRPATTEKARDKAYLGFTGGWYRLYLIWGVEATDNDQHDGSIALESSDAAPEPRCLRGVRGVLRPGRPDVPILRQR